jgi:hypothetical protein
MWRWRATYHWKALDEGYNFALKLTSIRGLHTKLWASKVARIPLGNLETKWHLGAGQTQSILLRGRWWLPPSLGRGESCEFMFGHGLSMHQKCFNSTLTNLLFGLCRSACVIEPFIARPNPISELQHTPLPAKCYEPGIAPEFLLLLLFSPLDSQLSPSRSLGVRHGLTRLNMA